MGVDDSVDVETAAAVNRASTSRRRADAARTRERRARTNAMVVASSTRARAETARGVARRAHGWDYRASTCAVFVEIVAMAPSRVVVSSSQLARSRPRSLSTSRRVRTSRATIDDDDAVADAFRKMYSPNADKSIHFGVFTRDVDPAAIPSDEEARVVVRSPRANSR